jgi:hypothetical protein
MNKKNKQEEQLDAIRDMRNLMERSSRFLSLSGLAGVAVGIIALMGVFAFFLKVDISPWQPVHPDVLFATAPEGVISNLDFLLKDALLILACSLAVGIWMSANRARKNKHSLWDVPAKRLLINLMIPLLSGGILCLIFIDKGLSPYLASMTLVFYGLALVNASKYSLDEIRNLGLLEILCGLLAAWEPKYGILIWGIGFGVLHIGYGLLIHSKQKQ